MGDMTITPPNATLTLSSDTVSFRSHRLMYKAIEPEEDDSFIHEVAQDSPAWQQFMRELPVPKFKAATIGYRQNIQGALFSAIICLPAAVDSRSIPVGILEISHLDRHVHHSHVNIGIIIHSPFRGRGYGREAIFWALKWCFLSAGLHRAEIGCFSYNDGARRLYSRLGFKQEAVMREWIWYQGKWWDKIVFGVLEKDWRELVGEEEAAGALE